MLVGRGQVATEWVMGFGHRVSWWDRDPTVAELDAVTGQVPTILISGDAHNGWLNSAALALFGVSHHEGPVFDAEWFPLYERMMAFGGWAEMQAAGQADVLQHCLELGIVGFRDFSRTADPAEWVGREDFPLRVSLGVYPEGLEERIALGVRAGDPLPGAAFAGPELRREWVHSH